MAQNAVLKSLDLVLLSLQLHEMLESGSPQIMMRAFALFVGSNALSCAIMILFSHKFSVMAEIFVDARCVSCLLYFRLIFWNV